MLFAPALILTLCLIQPPQVMPPKALRDEMAWLMTYYQKPDLTRLKRFAGEFFKPENVQHPFFAAKQDVQENLNVFLGIVAQDSPELVRYYESLWPQTDTKGRRLLVQTFFCCGDAKTKAQIATWKKDADPILEKELEFLDHFLASKKKWKRPSERAAEKPQDLDQCWMEFFATGQFGGPARVLDAIDSAKDTGMREAAKWSFESICQTHPRLVKLAKDALPDRQGASKEFLERILSK